MDFCLQQTRRSCPAYIAWISTCLLAAGLGPVISPETRSTWMQFGAFGLAAAVGLEISGRVRQFGHNQRSNRAIQRRYERELGNLTANRIAAEELELTVGHILQVSKADDRQPPPRRIANRFRCKLPVMITELLDDGGDVEKTSPTPFQAELRDVSSSGFGLKHDRPITLPFILMSVTLPTKEKTALLGEMMWCKRNSEGQFKSGGRFVRVLHETEMTLPDEALKVLATDTEMTSVS